MVTLSTPDASVFSATECLSFDLQLTCNGTPTAATVTLTSRYQPMPTMAGGTFFSTSDCQGPVSSVLPGQRSFRVASAGFAAVAGDWELTGTAMGASTTKTVTFSGKLERPPVTQLVLGVCSQLQSPRFVGLNDSSLVAFGTPATFDMNTLPSGATICSGLASFTLAAGQSTTTSMPSLRATVHAPGISTIQAQGLTPIAIGLGVQFDYITCFADGGVARLQSDCCQPGAATTLADGGYFCP